MGAAILRKLIVILLIPCFVSAYTIPPLLTVDKPTGGTDRHVGSGQTYASIDAAESACDCGDTIIVHSGTYSEFTWDKDCSSGNEVVIESAGDGDAIFQPSGSDNIRINGDYLIIDGGSSYELTVDGDDVGEGTYVLQIIGSHVTVSRFHMYDAGLNVGGGGGMYNIGIRGDYANIYNCLLENGYSGGVYVYDGDYVNVKNNRVGGNGGTGIQSNPHSYTTSDEVVISGNAIYDNGHTHSNHGITGLSSSNNYLRNLYIYNNLVWDNYRGITLFGAGAGDSAGANIRVFNNTLYSNSSYDFTSDTSNGTAEIRNNNSGDFDYGSQTQSNNDTSPSYVSVDDTNDNFLKITALNPGYDTNPPVSIDYFGGNRSATVPDIGAHEYLVIPVSTSTGGGSYSKH